ncbi:unnamed protein product [Gadus morhua 'NCC']
MKAEASMNYHICVDEIYTREQKVDHSYRFELDDLQLINASQEHDNQNRTTASQDTDSSQPLCSTMIDDMDENGNGDTFCTTRPLKTLQAPVKRRYCK